MKRTQIVPLFVFILCNSSFVLLLFVSFLLFPVVYVRPLVLVAGLRAGFVESIHSPLVSIKQYFLCYSDCKDGSVCRFRANMEASVRRRAGLGESCYPRVHKPYTELLL